MLLVFGRYDSIDARNESQIGGSAHAGQGVKVAIVDSGIDIQNPCFSDAGFQRLVLLLLTASGVLLVVSALLRLAG